MIKQGGTTPQLQIFIKCLLRARHCIIQDSTIVFYLEYFKATHKIFNLQLEGGNKMKALHVTLTRGTALVAQ